MNIHKRIVASLAAISMVSTINYSIAANAVSVPDNDPIFAELKEEMQNLASSSYYYVNYDTYTSSKISPTTHYLSAVSVVGDDLPQGSIYFYINMNAIPASTTDYINHIDYLRFKTAPYYSNSSITNISDFNETASVKRISLYWNSGLSNTTAPCSNELFRYDLTKFSGNLVVPSELMLHRYTSRYANNPSTMLDSTDDATIYKIVFSLGDLDRDGDVDYTDKQILMQYCANVTSANPSRTSTQQELDTVAFKLAADVDEDGDVTVLDAVYLNNYLSNSTNFPL